VDLELFSNNARDVDLEALARSPDLGNLASLDLAGNKFGLRGVRALAASTGLGSLGRVNLGPLGGLEQPAAWALTTSATLPWLRPVHFKPGGSVLHGRNLSGWWAFPTRVPFRHWGTDGTIIED
jgi:hypothetical protein